MGKPIAKIKCADTGYYFAVYPGNNHKQRLGSSRVFDTFEECEKEWQLFRELVISCEINTITNPHIETNINEPGQSNRFYKIVDNTGKTVFTCRLYSTKASCRNGVGVMYRAVLEIINAMEA